MRVYILSNAHIIKKKIIPKLEPYFYDIRKVCYIWSIAGLLQVENNKIYNIKIKDVLSRKTLLGAFPITIDESEFIREEECFQVVPRSYNEYITLKTYRLPYIANDENSSALEWIFEYKNNELHDNYFSFLMKENDIHSPKIKATILHFINL